MKIICHQQGIAPIKTKAVRSHEIGLIGCFYSYRIFLFKAKLHVSSSIHLLQQQQQQQVQSLKGIRYVNYLRVYLSELASAQVFVNFLLYVGNRSGVARGTLKGGYIIGRSKVLRCTGTSTMPGAKNFCHKLYANLGSWMFLLLC